MKLHRSRIAWNRRIAAFDLLVVVLGLALVLVGCGGPEPTPQVLVVTATFTPEPAVVVVTATFTPTPWVLSSDTPQALPSPESLAAVPTDTPIPPEPTVTPVPPEPTVTPVPPEPTPTPIPAEPTATVAVKSSAPTATPASKTSAPSLKYYFVVYTHYQGPDVQNYSLWGMNGDGSGGFHLEGAGQASEPAFSPDGNKFAFYHWTDGVYIWDLMDDTSMRVVDNSEAAFATWSPNGQRLAYANLYGQPQIFIVNADGSDNHPVTPGLRPNWSLKGGFIAYDSCENNKCGIFRINPDGGGKRQLTEDGGGGAAVSPNGNQIAYWSQADGDFEIYVIDAGGSGKRQLTKNGGNDALPAWSPDGKVVYYLSDQDGTGWAVMAMNADGSNKRAIVNTNGSSDPARGWQYQRITVTWND
jgi:dipeptidyl aminopeptidase/acylaminoacyl peptidase